MNEPAGIAIDGNGNVFVANIGDGTIHEFSSNGADLGTFGVTGNYSQGDYTLPDTLVFAPVPEPPSALLMSIGSVAASIGFAGGSVAIAIVGTVPDR